MIVKRFKMPAGCPVASVDIREISGSLEMEAAQMADALGTEETVRAMVEAERREAIRLSIVRLDDRVIDHQVPLLEIDGWSRKARQALGRYFDDVNGVSMADVRKIIAAGEPVTDATGRHGKRYAIPRGAAEGPLVVVLWELTGHDELAVALASDALPAKAGLGHRGLFNKRALVKAALRDQQVDLDALGLRALTILVLCFDAVNGVPEEEIQGHVDGAVVVSGAAPSKNDEPPRPEVAAVTG